MSGSSNSARQIARKATSAASVKVAAKVPRAPRAAQRPAIILNDTEVARICIEADCSLRTVQHWAAGHAVFRTTKLRLEKAMMKLGIERRERAASPEHGKRRRIVEVAS